MAYNSTDHLDSEQLLKVIRNTASLSETQQEHLNFCRECRQRYSWLGVGYQAAQLVEPLHQEHMHPELEADIALWLGDLMDEPRATALRDQLRTCVVCRNLAVQVGLQLDALGLTLVRERLWEQAGLRLPFLDTRSESLEAREGETREVADEARAEPVERVPLTPAYYRELRLRLLHKAYQYLHDWSQAEDLVQETFIQMIRKADQFRGESSHSTWVHSILFHRLCSRRIRPEVPVDMLAESQPHDESEPFTLFVQMRNRWDPREDVERTAISRQKLERVMALIPVILTDRYSCQALNLLFLQHLSYDEAARILGVRVDHLQKIVCSARRKLMQSTRIREVLQD